MIRIMFKVNFLTAG